ncbi:MAG: hypothetical protein IJ644_05105, partial [Oscillospiraceae bacterium]|nr:hypothetical protein [Oscillospiraceae bacterium]
MTLQAERFIEQWFGNDSFHVVMAHKGRLTEEMKQEVTESDMVLLLGSVFHLDIYSYMMELLDNMTKDEEFIQILREKPVTFLSTSGLQGDNYAHNTVTKWAVSHRMKWINSLSLHLSALLTDEGCEELFCWFNYVKSMAVC